MAPQANEDPRPGAGTPSRRGFLAGLGLAGAGLTVASCEGDTDAGGHGDHGGGGPEGPSETVPDDAASTGAPSGTLQFLNEHQARTVEAITARLIPGTEAEPGAREAGAVFYIDNLLASHQGYPQPTYVQGPFAQTYSGDEPPPAEAGVVWVPEDELARYGWQSAYVPRDIYRMGLARLDALSGGRFGDDFVDVSEEQQDELLAAVEDGEDDDVTEIFDDLPPDDLFEMVRNHTLEGFLADPVHGGNRDAVGWRYVGFPGARRSYSPQDMLDEGYDLTPQTLLDLPAFNADRPSHHHEVALAVRTRPPNAPLD